MATAQEVIGTLHSRGVTLEPDGSGGLRVNGISRLSERERTALKAHKSAILKVLTLAPTPPPTPPPTFPSSEPVTANLTATEPATRECRNCAHFEPYPFEPILGSCHALKRMQNAGSKPARFGCSNFEPKEGLL